MEERKKSWFKRHPILTIGSLIFILLFINGIIFSSISPQENPKQNSNTYSSDEDTNKEEQNYNSNSYKTWHQVTSFSGNGDKNTDTFYIKGSKFKMTYTLAKSNDYSVFSFFVYPESETIMYTDSVMTDMGKEGTDSTISYHGAGTYYLSITSANLDNWDIIVEDYY